MSKARNPAFLQRYFLPNTVHLKMQLAGAESWYPHFPEDFVVVQFKKDKELKDRN